MTTTTTAVPALRMTGIRKSFPGTLALDGAELEVRRGEVHCLLGENGAGKSTLMKVLAGSYRADAGEVQVDGRTVALTGPQAGIAAGVHVIYQELDLVPDLTVAQNLFLGHAPSRGPLVRRGERNRLAAEAVARVGGRFPVTAPVRTLSVSDQQLTAIAKAVTADAQVLVMDEPSATLTAHDLRAVFELVRQLTAEGRSVVYISHRLDEVKEIGDRATVMRDGRTVTTVDLADTTEEQLVTAMIGRPPTERRRPRSDVGSRPPLLELRRVHIPGVLDVSGITVASGEVVGLAGLGGAGRTTLLSAVFGGCAADLEASLDGQPLRSGRPAASVRAGIGLVPEDRKGQGLLRELSVHRNAGLAALKPAGVMPRRFAASVARTPLQELGVKFASGDQPVGQLSGGNQQKVVLAKWMARGVRVLLLDEPTRGLDIGAKEDLFRQVHRLAESGVAVLLASSELPELTANSDTVWVLYEGRNVARYDPHTASEEEIARTVVTGSPQS